MLVKSNVVRDNPKPLEIMKTIFEDKVEGIEEMLLESYRILADKIEKLEVCFSNTREELVESINTNRRDIKQKMDEWEQRISQSYQDMIKNIPSHTKTNRGTPDKKPHLRKIFCL
jgi:hypothetical protein